MLAGILQNPEHVLILTKPKSALRQPSACENEGKQCQTNHLMDSYRVHNNQMAPLTLRGKGIQSNFAVPTHANNIRKQPTQTTYATRQCKQPMQPTYATNLCEWEDDDMTGTQQPNGTIEFERQGHTIEFRWSRGMIRLQGGRTT